MSQQKKRWIEVGLSALKLGLTSFGGPVAHIGYFRQFYVSRKKWLSEEAFADLTALCQFLPGPASSQLGIAIGMQRAGMAGGIAAWLGFTLPSAALLVAFAFGLQASGFGDSGWLHGLKLAAAAVVAQAVWSMARTLTPDRPRIAMAALTASFAILTPGIAGQLVPILACGAAGALFLGSNPPAAADDRGPGGKKTATVACLALFFALLAVLPLAAAKHDAPWLQFADIGYRAGALVFGGGHVVLPLLHEQVAATGLVGEEQFLAGYGAAQAIPGPLFTFAAYLGAVSAPGLEGLLRAAVALAFIFLPSFLLVAGVMPYWSRLRQWKAARSALSGVNASVVGLLFAALYDPVWTSSVRTPVDLIFAGAALLALAVWKCPPWLLVLAAAGAGWLIFV
ncbi:chromate efflux transporter [Paenibacillaceae bacterium WGS1546]|uniref:chromate efflux transporter n=1 Tax=Cohnella sp. WGS1546 TaxID=3366810 RepID=UPI00372D02A8